MGQTLGQLQTIFQGLQRSSNWRNQSAMLLAASSSQWRSNWVSPKLAHNPFLRGKHARVPSRCLRNCYPCSPFCQLHIKVMFTPHLERQSWVYTDEQNHRIYPSAWEDIGKVLGWRANWDGVWCWVQLPGSDRYEGPMGRSMGILLMHSSG